MKHLKHTSETLRNTVSPAGTTRRDRKLRSVVARSLVSSADDDLLPMAPGWWWRGKRRHRDRRGRVGHGGGWPQRHEYGDIFFWGEMGEA
jgi:hypothetical protein